MADFRKELPMPQSKKIESWKMAAEYTGPSSNTLVAFVKGEIGFVTPLTYVDYIERVPWKKLLPEVIQVIDNYGKNASTELHKRHFADIQRYHNSVSSK